MTHHSVSQSSVSNNVGLIHINLCKLSEPNITVDNYYSRSSLFHCLTASLFLSSWLCLGLVWNGVFEAPLPTSKIGR